jgi:predicted ester cyclase
MSVQTDLLRELVTLCNERKTFDVARFFTEDFRLEDPGSGVIRTGLDGARRMIEEVRALAHDGRLEILDMFESGDRVAVRWSYKGQRASFAMMAIYEFTGNRIRRDWGILARTPWTDYGSGPQPAPDRRSR